MDRNEMTKRLNSAWAWAKKPVAGVPPLGWMIATAVGVFIFLSWDCIRCWMQEGGKETNGETLRNFLLILAALLSPWLAIWRSTTADKQADIAQRGLQIERFQKGADMLGSGILATRIGGIYSLERLAQNHPEEYHIQIMDLLCAFIRYPRKKNADSSTEVELQTQEDDNRLEPDTQEALTVIGRRGKKQRDLERKQHDPETGEKWRLNLSKACLDNAKLDGANLESANLRNAYLRSALLRRTYLMAVDMEDACLGNANLRNANLTGANLKGACLTGVELENAKLGGAVLTDADLMEVRCLTQTMLDSAAHFDDEGKPLFGPNLEEAFCAESGEQLVWWNSPIS